MNREKYYIAPSDEIFHDIKEAAIKIWHTYDDEDNYATKKINRIKDIQNIRDNACFIVAMFDSVNQLKLLLMTSGPTKIWLHDMICNRDYQ